MTVETCWERALPAKSFKGPSLMKGYWKSQKETAELSSMAGCIQVMSAYKYEDGYYWITDVKRT